MNRKLIENEGRRWVELGIVSPAQYGQIMKLYTGRSHAIGLVPLLGSILLGLGLISFIAANWQGIPEIYRIVMIIVAMCGFYYFGDNLVHKNDEKLGIAFIGLGLITFGTGILLIAQIFHLQAYDAKTWIIWSLAGILLTFLYKSRFLFLLGLIIITITQWYSTVEFSHFSYITFAIFLVGMGAYCWIRKDTLLSWLFSISFIIQSFMLVEANDWHFLWVFIPFLFLYTLGDATQNRSIAAPLQSSVLMTMFSFGLYIVLVVGNQDHLDLYDHMLAKTLPFLLSFALLFAVSFLLKYRANKAISALDWIITPVLLYLTIPVDLTYVILLFLFSSYLLWRGYVQEWRFKINLGTLLFLVSTMAAYIKLTWDFMDKSLFFIIGGALLLILSWLLGRGRNKILAKEVDEHA